MSKRKKVVPADNVRELSIGSVNLKLEASLGASIAYANEFRGKLDEPYKGSLSDDMLQAFRRSRMTVSERVKVDESGDVALDDDGMWTEDPNGEIRDVANPDYVGIDVEAVLRIAWAMAFASGSMRKGYDAFLEEVIHQPAGVLEEARLFNVVVVELGGGIIFRVPEGQEGAGQPDEAQAEEGQEG